MTEIDAFMSDADLLDRLAADTDGALLLMRALGIWRARQQQVPSTPPATGRWRQIGEAARSTDWMWPAKARPSIE
jgi:hypothetical protein